MLKKSPKGYYYLAGLAKQKGLVHGFSTRKLGDCNPLRTPQETWPRVEEFLKVLGLKRNDLSVMEQVHGDRIKILNKNNFKEIFPGVDGLITQEKGLVLGIHTADCLPIFYYDPSSKIIGVAHAGWRGVYKEMPRKMIELMIRLGSLPERIIIGIGPFIGSCCYEVKKDFADRFVNKFGSLEGMIINRQKKVYLDLAKIACFQLMSMGIKKKNIELPAKCTSCHHSDFFSNRKDKPENYGGILGVISLR